MFICVRILLEHQELKLEHYVLIVSDHILIKGHNLFLYEYVNASILNRKRLRIYLNIIMKNILILWFDFLNIYKVISIIFHNNYMILRFYICL